MKYVVTDIAIILFEKILILAQISKKKKIFSKRVSQPKEVKKLVKAFHKRKP